MESRKRKSELEKYVTALTDPPEKQRKMAEFYNSLRMFYKRRWNAQLKLPNVQGVEVNLYRLYDTVMALGGWQKVASGDKWSDIAEMFGCKDDILCGDHAIKIIYMRYLSKFEQVQTIGDVDDYVDNEMSRSRGRNATSFFATNDCPIAKSTHHQPARDAHGQIVNEPDYARLVKSLMSGLPNEIDFAMNVCMLLSHAGPKQLRICHAPTLLTLLVAHTGVYDDEDPSMASLGATWKQNTLHDFRQLWKSSGVPSELLASFLGESSESSSSSDQFLDDDDEQFFTAVSSNYDVKDPRCWRINQVTTIIRNLSFEPANRVTIVKTWPVMKFLIMCASCKWSPLYVAAFDALSNLSTDINLTDKTLVHLSHHAILRIIHNGIFNLDKLKLVRSLEMLTGLCSFEGNESIICEWLTPEIISHVFEIVGVKDIMMCVYTLECLYQISEMGDTACDLIADNPKAIQQLVSMATLEAVSFGPAGLAGMKVVEYQPQFQAPQGHPGHHGQQGHPAQHPPPHGTPRTPGPSGHPGPAPMTVRQVIQNNLALQQVQREQMHVPPPQPAAFPAPHSTRVDRRSGNIPVRPIAPSDNSGQLEQLTEKWIKQNCVFEPNMSTARGELYAAYVDDLRNIHHSMSGSLAMFSGVMKNLYPDVNFRMAQNGIMIVAQGIRLVRPHRLAPAASQSAQETHPLMSKMLAKDTEENQNVDIKPQTPEEKEDQQLVNGAAIKIEVDKKTLTNGSIEICQSPIRASKLFDENGDRSEVRIEIHEQQFVTDSNGVKLETPEKNGVLCNGNSTKAKKESMASRAAHIVAVAAACNGDLNKLNGLTNGKKEQEETPDAQEDSEVSEESPVAPPSTEEPTEEQGSKSSKVPTASKPTDFMCDWDCCSLFYSSPSHVLKHLAEEHVAEELRVLCRWNGCQDPTPRNRWSLITHIQDSHCNESQLKMAAQKRRENGGAVGSRGIARAEVVPRDLSNHPGYAKNAAYDAIRRHAFNYLARELTDEAEGPVTKSIRLTSCLILRNLARYSAEGRQKLRRHESHICWLALSRLESSHALSQLLSELHQTPATEEESVPKMLSEVPSCASLASIVATPLQRRDSDSPSTSSQTPVRRSESSEVPKSTVNRVLTFESGSSNDVPTTPPVTPSSESTYRRPPPAPVPQPHILPTQSSPIVAQKTTPVRAGVGL